MRHENCLGGIDIHKKGNLELREEWDRMCKEASETTIHLRGESENPEASDVIVTHSKFS